MRHATRPVRLGGRYLAVDIGGTAIKYGLVDPEQRLVDLAKVPTPRVGGPALVDAVLDLVRTIASRHALAGVGISTAGTLDRESRAVVFAAPTIPGYAGTAWPVLLRRVVEVPVAVENDAVAALKGELWKGNLGSADDVYYVTLGTGIGGAYGRRSARGGWCVDARAIGYLLPEPATGAYWESRASVAGLNAAADAKLGSIVDAEALFARARHGDRACVGVLADWAAAVAEGLVEITLASEPQYIVIGGAISAQGAWLRDLLADAWSTRLPPRPLRTKLRIAELANRAALYGAVYPLLVEN